MKLSKETIDIKVNQSVNTSDFGLRSSISVKDRKAHKIIDIDDDDDSSGRNE